MAVEIPLNRGLVTLVDDNDAEMVLRHKWCASGGPRKGRTKVKWYVRMRLDSKHCGIMLHRFLLSPPAHLSVDHKNGDSLDNRRSNLRLCTQHQNSANQIRAVGKSGYRGVHASGARWYVRLESLGRVMIANGFECPIAAAREYDRLAREHFGEFAILNFPDNVS